MIVDDDPFCTMLVKGMLEALGQIVDTAEDGKIGVGMYQKNCKGYKFILMDFHMPEVDGFEATKQIRTLEKYLGLSVPIVGLTGDDVKQNSEIEQHALGSGMNQVMSKPINLQILCSLSYIVNDKPINYQHILLAQFLLGGSQYVGRVAAINNSLYFFLPAQVYLAFIAAVISVKILVSNSKQVLNSNIKWLQIKSYSSPQDKQRQSATMITRQGREVEKVRRLKRGIVDVNIQVNAFCQKNTLELHLQNIKVLVEMLRVNIIQ
eukprot:403352992